MSKEQTSIKIRGARATSADAVRKVAGPRRAAPIPKPTTERPPTQPSCLEAALDYAKRGWPVFPFIV